MRRAAVVFLSAFSLGYVTTQLAGGVLGDRIGTKAVITLTTILAGLLTLAGGSTDSVSALWWTQVLMGAAQGPLFPTSIAYLTRWCPPAERAFVSSLLDAGITENGRSWFSMEYVDGVPSAI